ncbi:hypothetical protein HD553DRAFT_349206 [Filobasidium floriforme]|uniref:uncharacterized protein n=1 Tax=Filobasidium floriforme TaxID=5210 RepID=UPI001E8DEDCD|nr:uncharacterized protein HD553DRAFT_349206 [Filobasidium floriforme]KAH8087009.1 hypothetical protein HD553DRAFT_349206 [Filobasidium floriforme]
MSSFQALLAEKAKEKAKKEAIIAEKRKVEEERLNQEKAAKIKKQKEDEEEAKRLRILSRKKDLELAEKSKKAAEEKAYLEKKREEDRKRVIKEKILGKDKPSDYSPMAKIKQASHPSLARPTPSSSSSAPTPGTPGYASHRSHASSSSSHAAPVVLTRQERKALADAREFGLTPGAKAASTRTRGGWREGGPGKMSLEEEGISRLAKLTAERAGLVDVPPAARGNGNIKGKGREVDSTRRTVSAPVNGKNRNGDKTSDRAGSSKIGGDSGEGSSRRPEPGPRVLTPRKPREMDRAGSPSSSRPTPRLASDPRSSRPTPRKRPRSPSPDTESSLDSDDLDRNERSKRRATGKGRDRDRDSGRGSSGRANGGGGGGILASLGFDAYQSFSRSGKDREQYMRNTTFSDEDSDDMEANAATIAKEEARAARLAREQDRLEEEMERKRKEEKMKRRAGK